MTKNKLTKGRPVKYTEASVVRISAKEGATKLQKGSDRRVMIDLLIEAGGRLTLGEIDSAMGYDCKYKIAALARSGWLEIVESV
jgi:hypothetical protein